MTSVAQDLRHRPTPREFVDQLVEAADLANQRILDDFDPHPADRSRDQRRVGVQAGISEEVSDVAPASRWWLSRNPVSHSKTSSTSAWVRPFSSAFATWSGYTEEKLVVKIRPMPHYLNQPAERNRMDNPDPGPFYHGTKAALEHGGLLQPGFDSNFGAGRTANFVYLTATLDAAIWGAELAAGDQPGRIYQVEPTGPFEDDPNLTDKKFPGNPTRSYRTRHPLRILGEVTNWEPHPPEVLQHMLDHLAELKAQGVEAINE